MMDLEAFIAKYNITMELCTRANDNPNMHADGKERMHHYHVTLANGSPGYKRMRLSSYFSMGSAHTRIPTVQDLLSCFASDVGSIESARSVEMWASDMGYSIEEPADLKKAKHTYRACEKERESLKRFLGEQAYDELIYKVEG